MAASISDHGIPGVDTITSAVGDILVVITFCHDVLSTPSGWTKSSGVGNTILDHSVGSFWDLYCEVFWATQDGSVNVNDFSAGSNTEMLATHGGCSYVVVVTDATAVSDGTGLDIDIGLNTGVRQVDIPDADLALVLGMVADASASIISGVPSHTTAATNASTSVSDFDSDYADAEMRGAYIFPSESGDEVDWEGDLFTTGGDGVSALVVVPLTLTTVVAPEVNPYRYTRRRFGCRALPYDITSIRLGDPFES